MFSATYCFRRVVLTLPLVVLSFLQVGICSAATVNVVNETFDGYTFFPNEKPPSDPLNFGVPLTSEGADSPLWIAVRLEEGGDFPNQGSIFVDVGVQSVGSIIAGQNATPTGRVGDDAGLVLRLDLTGLKDVTLDFDWRTFMVEAGDQFVVAYYKGDGTAFQPGGLGTPNNTYDWYGDPQLGNGSTTWYDNNWVELMRDGPSDLFQHETFSLPGDDIVYLAFWNDDNDNIDFGKFDNVVVVGTVIPEPSSLVLVGLGIAAAFVGLCRNRCLAG